MVICENRTNMLPRYQTLKPRLYIHRENPRYPRHQKKDNRPREASRHTRALHRILCCSHLAIVKTRAQLAPQCPPYFDQEKTGTLCVFYYEDRAKPSARHAPVTFFLVVDFAPCQSFHRIPILNGARVLTPSRAKTDRVYGGRKSEHSFARESGTLRTNTPGCVLRRAAPPRVRACESPNLSRI